MPIVQFDDALNETLEDEEAPLPANLRAAANIDTQIGTATQAALDLKLTTTALDATLAAKSAASAGVSHFYAKTSGNALVRAGKPFINVKDFGVVGDNSTNDTTALDSALDSGESIYFPPGTYCKIDGTLTVATDGQKLFAPGWGQSSLEVYGDEDALVFSSADPENTVLYDVGMTGLRIRRQGDTTAGAGVRMVNCSGAVLENYDIRYHLHGLDVEGCTSLNLLNGQISAGLGWSSLHSGSFFARFRHAIYGALRKTCSEVFVNNFNWKANDTNGYVDQALIIRGCDGLWFVNGHTGFANLDCIDIGLESATDNIISVLFSNVYADASFVSDRAVRISDPSGVVPTTGKIWEVKFDGGTLGLAEEGGVLINTAAARSISFDGTSIRSNKGFGVEVSAGRMISFSDCDISQNDRDAVGSAGGGVKISGATLDVQIQGGCIAGLTATQRTGIDVSGTADRITVDGVHFGENTADKSVTTSGTTYRFSNCVTDKGETSAINVNQRMAARTGSAAAPSVVVGDDNTGLYSPGSDIVSMAAGGKEVIRADLLSTSADTRLSVRANVSGVRMQANGAAGGNATFELYSLGTSPIYLGHRSGSIAVTVADIGAVATKQVELRPGDGSNNPKIGSSSGALELNSPLAFPTYTVATLPSAATYTRCVIYVSDETGGAVIAFSDGTNWRRVTDRAVVS